MQRGFLVYVLGGLAAGVGCGLLTPYPGDGNPAEILAGQSGGTDGSPFNTGDPQGPLLDPAFDDSVSIISNEDVIVANPGQAFTVDLEFSAENNNVVGGGIQFPGSDEIQWTFIDGLEGEERGRIQFGYVVDANICDQVPPLCHKIETQQFAVARNVAPNGDVDGDGNADGEFVVSKPEDVTVVLRCSSCDSPSCRDIEELAGECQFCNQPPACQQVFEMCFQDGRPKFDTDEADDFERFFGPDGLAWRSGTVCIPDGEGQTAADQLCNNALDDALVECVDEDTDTDTATDGAATDGAATSGG